MKKSERSPGEEAREHPLEEDEPLSLIDVGIGFGKKLFGRDIPRDSFDFGNNAPTILLVPGFFGDAEDMTFIGEPLKERMNVAYAPNLPFLNMGDIISTGILLRQKIAQVLLEEKNGDLNLLGHSIGGLEILESMRQSRFEARSIITCSTPFGGVPKAKWAPFISSCRQIVPGARYVTDLRGICIGKTALDVHVSMRDGIVPPENQVPPHGMSDKTTIIQHPDNQHFDYLLGKKAKKFAHEIADRLT